MIILIILLILIIAVLLIVYPKFSEVINSDGTVIDTLEASVNNSPDIGPVIYTTPSTYLGTPEQGVNVPADIGFQRYPLLFLIDEDNVPDLAAISKPPPSILLGSQNLINLTTLFSLEGPNLTINSGDPTKTSNTVSFIIPGLKEVIKEPLIVAHNYYLGISLLSNLPSIYNTNNIDISIPNGFITSRYSVLTYKKLTFSVDKLIEVLPGAVGNTTVTFGTLNI